MKKTLSLLLVLAMVLSSFGFAFAAEDEIVPAEFLNEKGILKGNAEGNLMLEDNLKRQDMVVMLSRLLGVEEEAKAYEGETTFTDIADPFYVPYIAWAEAEELTEGVGDNKFGFDRAVKENEVAAFLLRALGYTDVKWEDVPAKAVELGLVEKDADLDKDAKREVLANLTYKALGMKMKDSEKTLAEHLEIEMPVPEVLEVEEVVADNLKEIKVVFNKAVDEESALDLNNYDTDAGDIEDIVYLADENTAIITLKDAMDNKEEYELIIDGVKDGKTVLDVTEEFKAIDNAIPEAVEVIGLGTKAIKVVMSEPVETANGKNFSLDGKTIYGTFKPAGRDIIVKTYSNMSIGEHELTVKNLKDYAEFKSLETKHSFEVVEDKDAPTVAEVKAPALEKAIVTFSEDVDDATVNLKTVYWKNGGTKVYPSSYTRLAGNKYSFTFAADNALPVHETTLYVESVKDYSGNKMENVEIAVKASIDETRPEVKKVEIKESGKIVLVTFSKAVNEKKATDVANYRILDSDDNKITINNISAADKTLRVFKITLGKALDAAEKYTLKISDIHDNTKYKNYMADYSETISASDYSAPELTDVVKSMETKSGKKVYTLTVYFDRDMDLATVSDPANYLINIDDSYNKVLSSLDYDINVIKSDGSIVVITITVKDKEVTGLAGLGVKGNNGKELTNYGTMMPLKDSLGKITLKKYQATAKDTVKLTFSNDIEKAPKDAFTVEVKNEETYTSKAIEDVTISGKVVTLTLEEKALDAGDYNYVTIKPNSDKETVKAFDGRTFEVERQKLTDEIAPSFTGVSAVRKGTTITITAKFDEAMKPVIEGATENELTVIASDNGEEIDYELTNGGVGELVITINAAQENLKEVDQTIFIVEIAPKDFILDLNDNAANEKELRTGNITGIKAAVTDKEAAKAVEDKINALPPEITLDNKAAVEAARAAYDGLTADQKTLVADVLNKLTAAEDMIAVLEASDKISSPIASIVVEGGSEAVESAKIAAVKTYVETLVEATTNSLTITVTANTEDNTKFDIKIEKGGQSVTNNKVEVTEFVEP